MLQTNHKNCLIAATLVGLVVGSCELNKLKTPAKHSKEDAAEEPAVTEVPIKEVALDGSEASPSASTDSTMSKVFGSSEEVAHNEACLSWLKKINSENFFYHVQSKIKKFQPQEERGAYLVPHLSVAGFKNVDQESLKWCSDAIVAIDSYPQLKNMQKSSSEEAQNFLVERARLSSIISEQIPMRTCALWLGSLSKPVEFKKFKTELAGESAELVAAKALKRFHTAGRNFQARNMTVRSCLTVAKTFKNAHSAHTFAAASSAEQFELLTEHATPLIYAH